jgi:oxaloacetate decarboxylase alpha subunit
VRKKYARFEGSLRGVDSRILVAQVPGGMLTNMESQLKEQGALDRFDEVLHEIPRVRKDLGFIPLVTPTSQIVGTQAVINVLSGERYKTIAKETAGVLRGEYGATPAPVDADLQLRVLEGTQAIMGRPADLLPPELDKLTGELLQLAHSERVELSEHQVDDVLTYALFPQIGWKFLSNRGNPSAFESAPGVSAEPPASSPTAAVVASGTTQDGIKAYVVTVNGRPYQVEVAPGGTLTAVQSASQHTHQAGFVAVPAGGGEVRAPMAGHILRINVKEGQFVSESQIVIVMEAMKMETEVRTRYAGTVNHLAVKVGDTVAADDVLLTVV